MSRNSIEKRNIFSVERREISPEYEEDNISRVERREISPGREKRKTENMNYLPSMLQI